MTPSEAKLIVARHCLSRLVEDYADEQWGSYPEIGEYCWGEIVDLMGRLSEGPENWEHFQEAYDVLEARADNG